MEDEMARRREHRLSPVRKEWLRVTRAWLPLLRAAEKVCGRGPDQGVVAMRELRQEVRKMRAQLPDEL